jgi:hypothetical protein
MQMVVIVAQSEKDNELDSSSSNPLLMQSGTLFSCRFTTQIVLFSIQL